MRDDTEQPQEDRGGRRGGVIRIDRPDDITSKLLLRKRNISPSPTDRQLKPGLLELSNVAPAPAPEFLAGGYNRGCNMQKVFLGIPTVFLGIPYEYLYF